MGTAHPWQWWGAGAQCGHRMVLALRCPSGAASGSVGVGERRGWRWRKWFSKEMRCEHSAPALSVWLPASTAVGKQGCSQEPGAGKGCGVAAALGSYPQPQLTTGTTERCWSWSCHGRPAATPLPRWEHPPLCCWPKTAPQDTLQSPALGTAGSTGWQRSPLRTSPALLLFLFISKGLKT